MAQTELHKYSVQEKLNKMDIDLIDITLTTDAETHSDNDAISLSIEIPNAVAVKGGAAIIQSVTLFNLDDSVESPAMELVFIEDNTAFASDEGGAVSATDSNLLKALGSTTVSNWSTFTPSTNEMASKQNIGMVCKAESDSKNLHVWLIAKGSTDWDVDTGVLRLGFIKD